MTLANRTSSSSWPIVMWVCHAANHRYLRIAPVAMAFALLCPAAAGLLSSSSSECASEDHSSGAGRPLQRWGVGGDRMNLPGGHAWLPPDDGSTIALLPHSLLQAAAPPRRARGPLPPSSELEPEVGPATSSAHESTNARGFGGAAVERLTPLAQAPTFVQMGEVTTVAKRVVSSKLLLLRGVEDQAWWSGFCNAVFLASAVIALTFLVLVSCKRCPGRQRLVRLLGCCCPKRGSSSARISGEVEVVRPEVMSPRPPLMFKAPELPCTVMSFGVPLMQEERSSGSGGSPTRAFAFDVPREPAGRPLHATISCLPVGGTCGTWAKVELIGVGADKSDVASPLASCSLVECAADLESHNIQGAMLSWLSLLVDEKARPEESCPQLTVMQHHPAVLRTSLYGMAEELMSFGECSAGGRDLCLEVRDCRGTLAGTLEPWTAGRCALIARQPTGGGDGPPQPVLEIEVNTDGRSISISREGVCVALATPLSSCQSRRGGPEEPEQPELTGDEDEHLQVDVALKPEGSPSSEEEAALLLVCTLAVIVFRPKPGTGLESVAGSGVVGGKIVKVWDMLDKGSEKNVLGSQVLEVTAGVDANVE